MTALQHFVTNLPLLLYTTSIVLHSTGLYLLTSVRRKRNQDLIIIQLSIAEIGMNVLDITQNIIARYPKNKQSLPYLIIVNCCFFVIPFFLIIIFLTIDRFLEVYFNIRYQVYFRARFVLLFLMSGWCIGFITGIVLLCIKIKYGIEVRKYIYKWMFPPYEVLFLVIAACTYCYIYTKYTRTRKQKLSLGEIECRNKTSNMADIQVLDSDKVNKETLPLSKFATNKIVPHNENIRKFNRKRKHSLIKKRNFFVPSFIILTFILFVLIPDMINMTYFYVSKRGTTFLSNILLCLYALGFIADALIYIFLQKHLRNLFLRKFCYRVWHAKSFQSSISVLTN